MALKPYDILKKIPAFTTLNEEDLQKIWDMTIERKMKKGTLIFMEGDPGEAFYFIKSGKVKVFQTALDGRELILTILGAGDVFAEVTLFNNIPYPASAEVIEDASIGMIRNEDLERLVGSNAEIGLRIIKVLNRKLFDSQQKVREMALGDTFMRIARILLRLAQEHGVETEGGIELKLNLSRQELANMIGTARETVSRVLSEFKKEGAIAIHGKKLLIKDKKKLQSWIQ